MSRKIRDLIPPAAKPMKFYGTSLSENLHRQLSQSGYEEIRKDVASLQRRLPESYPQAFTRVGIEVEVENVRLDRCGSVPLPWIVKADGSLRNNGAEFISLPILPQDVSVSVASLYGYMKAMKMSPDFSWRTSTHVHVEANQMSVQQFKNFLLLYLIFEDALFEFSRPGRRETNIFCTPLSRTDYQILRSIVKADGDESFVRNMVELPRRILKYSALNLAHIFGYGTVEFRHLGGEKDPEKICVWLQLILRLFESSCRADRNEIEQNVRELNTNSNYRHFLNNVFGELSEKLETNRRDLFLSNGVTVCKEILSADAPPPRPAKGQKTGLQLFGETEAKKQQRDPLEKKDKSRIAQVENVAAAPELEMPEIAGEDALFYLDDFGQRRYVRTARGAKAAAAWWNPRGFRVLRLWLEWRRGAVDYHGDWEEELRWVHNIANLYDPI